MLVDVPRIPIQTGLYAYANIHMHMHVHVPMYGTQALEVLSGGYTILWSGGYALCTLSIHMYMYAHRYMYYACIVHVHAYT